MTADQTRGLMYAAMGFCLLTVGDAIIKSIGGASPATAIAAARYSFGAIGLAALLWVREGKAGFSMPLPRVQIARGVLVGCATIGFFASLFLMPLAEATAITFTNPIFAALFSAWFLKERTTQATWVSILIAFAGVLIVLRPNVQAVGFGAVLPLISAMGMAGLMILNRVTTGKASVLALQFFISAIGSLFLITATLIGHFSGVPALVVPIPDWTIIAKCVVVAMTATTSHTLIFLATTKASAATVAPMVYAQLLLAIALGWLFFGDKPDLTAIAGAGLIVLAGLYLWWSQRAKAQG